MEEKNLDYLIQLTYDKTYKGYVADVVNLYGCMSQGKTKQEALYNTEKAIRAYMQALLKRTPKRSTLTKKTVAANLPISHA